MMFGRVGERLILVGCAPLLVYVGYKLFALGIAGQMNLTGELKDDLKVRLTNLSPGSFCFLLAIVIAGISFTRPLHLERSEEEGSKQIQQGMPLSTTASQSVEVSAGQASPVPAQTVTKKKRSIVEREEYEGGKVVGAGLLSADLRRALSEVALCQLSHSAVVGSNDCYASSGYYDRFIKIPVPDDLKGIEQIEARLRENPTTQDAITYANYKRVFLKSANP